MKRVKITVLKTTLDRDLAEEYGAEGLTACPMLREGQVFYADYAKPEGFCDEAWKAVYQYAFALAHGAGRGCSTTETGFASPAWPFVAATTACGPLSLSWRPRTRRPSPATPPCGNRRIKNRPRRRPGAVFDFIRTWCRRTRGR